jgi:hypothetical protein
MTALVWDKVGERYYENGIDRGVLFPTLGPQVAWNGLISVDEVVSGGDVRGYYFDERLYANIVGTEDFQAKLKAFSSPPEFEVCDGRFILGLGLYVSQQPKAMFGLSYRTRVGNDNTPELGYKIHIVYNCMAALTTRRSATLSNSADATSLEWSIYTVPVQISGRKPTAHLVIDSTKFSPSKIAALEAQLYGSVFRVTIPSPAEVVAILA